MKKLDETLNIPDLDAIRQAVGLISPENKEEISKEDIETSLKEVNEMSKDLEVIDEEVFDHEMDEIALQAEDAYGKLIEIAIDAETKAIGEIASAAERFLNTKLSAKTAKNNRKLELIKISIQERKLKLAEDKQKMTAVQADSEAVDSEGYIIMDPQARTKELQKLRTEINNNNG